MAQPLYISFKQDQSWEFPGSSGIWDPGLTSAQRINILQAVQHDQKQTNKQQQKPTINSFLENRYYKIMDSFKNLLSKASVLGHSN